MSLMRSVLYRRFHCIIMMWLCFPHHQTLSHRVGPVSDKMTTLEQEKRHAAREREEAETNSRGEIDSIAAAEHAVKDRNQAIMRCES